MKIKFFQNKYTFLIQKFNKRAFTLAEVLITLGVIGVVAAMTMPVLIANYHKKQIVTQLKKAYSQLSQAIKISELSNGEIEYWDFSLTGEKFFNQYLSPYLTSINISTFTKQNTQWKYLNGNDCNEDVCKGNAALVFLSDGSLLAFSKNSRSDLKAMTIDVNGLKRPNTYGKDTFVFWITKYNGLAPFGYGNFNSINSAGDSQTFEQYDRETLMGTNPHACNKDGKGIWCTALIMLDGWTMAKDYPW